MNKLAVVFVGLFALTCLGFSAILMPWAELGMPGRTTASDTSDARWNMRQNVIGKLPITKNEIVHSRYQPNSIDSLFDTYVYSVFLGVALVAAAIAINIVGREDSEEKTIIPAKK